jgi:hypothetical protein
MQGAMMPLDKLGTQSAAAPSDPTPQDPNARVEALRPFFEDAAARVMGKHTKAVAAHAGRKDFEAWYKEFSEEQIGYALSAFGPAFEMLGLGDRDGFLAARDIFAPEADEADEENLCERMMQAALAGLIAKG